MFSEAFETTEPRLLSERIRTGSDAQDLPVVGTSERCASCFLPSSALSQERLRWSGGLLAPSRFLVRSPCSSCS